MECLTLSVSASDFTYSPKSSLFVRLNFFAVREGAVPLFLGEKLVPCSNVEVEKLGAAAQKRRKQGVLLYLHF